MLSVLAVPVLTNDRLSAGYAAAVRKHLTKYLPQGHHLQIDDKLLKEVKAMSVRRKKPPDKAVIPIKEKAVVPVKAMPKIKASRVQPVPTFCIKVDKDGKDIWPEPAGSNATVKIDTFRNTTSGDVIKTRDIFTLASINVLSKDNTNIQVGRLRCLGVLIKNISPDFINKAISAQNTRFTDVTKALIRHNPRRTGSRGLSVPTIGTLIIPTWQRGNSR